MQNVIYSNKDDFSKKLENFKQDGLDSLYVVSDFDRTLTKAYIDNETVPSLISILRSEWILSEEYSKQAHALYDKYHPIETDPNIDVEEKVKYMEQWWVKHKKLLIKTWLKKEHILQAVKHKKLQLRDGVEEFLLFLKKHKIPLIIFSASGLWADSIKMFLKNRWIDFDNIFIISNEFIWDKDKNAIDFKKPVIHTFNKNEDVIDNFSSIQTKIKWKINTLLIWDSLWDANMVKKWNVVKIWFLNDKVDELLEEYKKKYDVVVLNDGDFSFINKLLW